MVAVAALTPIPVAVADLPRMRASELAMLRLWSPSAAQPRAPVRAHRYAAAVPAGAAPWRLVASELRPAHATRLAARRAGRAASRYAGATLWPPAAQTACARRALHAPRGRRRVRPSTPVPKPVSALVLVAVVVVPGRCRSTLALCCSQRTGESEARARLTRASTCSGEPARVSHGKHGAARDRRAALT